MIELAEKILEKDIFIIEQKLKKKEILSFIATHVAPLANISQKELLNHLIQRESISSTGFEKGIAIPHCQIEGLSEFHFGLIIAKAGVDFNSIDKEKSYALFYIVGPNNQKEQHIKLLSSASRLLLTNNLIAKLKEAQSPANVLELLLQASLNNGTTFASTQKMLFQIFVSSDTLFNQFLEVAVAQDIKSISVLEGESAASYIYKLPLFASFWSDQQENFLRVILLTVDAPMVNNLIREFYLIPDIEKMQNSFSLNVINLYFSAGKLEF